MARLRFLVVIFKFYNKEIFLYIVNDYQLLIGVVKTMKRGLLKKGIVIGIMLLLTGSYFVSSISGDINYKSEPVTISINQDENNIKITYEINDYTELAVNIEGKDYSIITIGEESNLMLKGKPDIPSICRSIVIPDTTKMKIDIEDIDYEEIHDVK